LSDSGARIYSESRHIFPRILAWPLFGLGVWIAGVGFFEAARGQSDLLEVPGMLGLLAVGALALWLPYSVELFPSHLVVKNTPRLARRVLLGDIERVEICARPPSRTWLTLPFSPFKFRGLGDRGGLELFLKSGRCGFVESSNPWRLAELMHEAAPHVRAPSMVGAATSCCSAALPGS